MGKISAALLITAFSASAAMAEPVPVIVDQEMGVRLFRVDESYSRTGGLSTVERAMSDDVAGVYCHWKNAARIDFAKKKITDFRSIELSCKPKVIGDAEQWEGGPQTNIRNVLTNLGYSYKTEGSLMIEQRTSGPNAMNVVSSYTRTWNSETGTVCLKMQEGLAGQEPYSVKDLGCYKPPGVS